MIGPLTSLSLKHLLLDSMFFLEYLLFLVLDFLIFFEVFCLAFTLELLIVMNKILETNKSLIFYLLNRI